MRNIKLNIFILFRALGIEPDRDIINYICSSDTDYEMIDKIRTGLAFSKTDKENIKNNEFQVLFSGITTNPPEEVQRRFNWGILQDVENIRGAGKVKEKKRYFTVEHESKKYEFYEIKPFFDLNKQAISCLYKEHNSYTSWIKEHGIYNTHPWYICGECIDPYSLIHLVHLDEISYPTK